MRTVISHFYNEEYMLPWWLDHHQSMFDHGILIDYGSTDNSADICRTLAPNWRLVRSRNTKFDAILVDFEVMQYESGIPGWKIALNVTEFLHSQYLDQIENAILSQDYEGAWIDGFIMVDPFPEIYPSHDNSLISQKYHGFQQSSANSPYTVSRSRLYHRSEIGAYTIGRHQSFLRRLVKTSSSANPAMLLWYGYSPWNPQALARKLQIQTQMSDRDKKSGNDLHLVDLKGLDDQRSRLLPFSEDLSRLINTKLII